MMIKRGVAARNGIAFQPRVSDLTKCPSCGKHISLKTASSLGGKCQFCGAMVSTGIKREG